MTNSQQPDLASLEAFLEGHPHITYAKPSSPDYASLRQIFSREQEAVPLAIVRPQSAADVAHLIKFATSNSIGFTVRVGGHNLVGACFAQNALAIDMRDIAYVDIIADKTTARVGGGILQLALATELEKEGLATPTGTIGEVGYVGWATYGGYGPFSSQWGLGVDQIVAAKVVNANGEVIDADECLLKGLRGGGGLFGVVVEITIKVYPLKEILNGTLIFSSQDIVTAFKTFNAGYQELSAKGLPLEMVLQQSIINSPQGRAMCVNFTWGSEDLETGRVWLATVEKLAPVAMNTVGVTTVPKFLRANSALLPGSAYGKCFTHNLRQITSDAASIIGNNLEKMADDIGCMFSVHELRGPSAAFNQNSIYGNRSPHFMLEILGFSITDENREISRVWAENIWNELGQTRDGNLLPGAYISLDQPAVEPGSLPLTRLYGSNAQEIRAIKEKYDSENVFALAIPQLQNYSSTGRHRFSTNTSH